MHLSVAVLRKKLIQHLPKFHYQQVRLLEKKKKSVWAKKRAISESSLPHRLEPLSDRCSQSMLNTKHLHVILLVLFPHAVLDTALPLPDGPVCG